MVADHRPAAGPEREHRHEDAHRTPGPGARRTALLRDRQRVPRIPEEADANATREQVAGCRPAASGRSPGSTDVGPAAPTRCPASPTIRAATPPRKSASRRCPGSSRSATSPRRVRAVARPLDLARGGSWPSTSSASTCTRPRLRRLGRRRSSTPAARAPSPPYSSSTPVLKQHARSGRLGGAGPASTRSRQESGPGDVPGEDRLLGGRGEPLRARSGLRVSEAARSSAVDVVAGPHCAPAPHRRTGQLQGQVVVHTRGRESQVPGAFRGRSVMDTRERAMRGPTLGAGVARATTAVPQERVPEAEASLLAHEHSAAPRLRRERQPDRLRPSARAASTGLAVPASSPPR